MEQVCHAILDFILVRNQVFWYRIAVMRVHLYQFDLLLYRVEYAPLYLCPVSLAVEIIVHCFGLRRKYHPDRFHISNPFAIAFLRFGLALCTHVMPFMVKAIFPLSSKYSSMTFRVLWLTCFGSCLFISGIVIIELGEFFMTFSTINTVLRVGEGLNFCTITMFDIRITFSY